MDEGINGMVDTINQLEKENENLKFRLSLVSGSLPIAELEEFFYEMGEDWHLWDEEEQGQYPIQRIFEAVKKFIAEKKLGNDR